MRIEGIVLENKGATSLVAIFRSAACGENCGHNCAACGGASRLDVEADNGGIYTVAGDRVVLESGTGGVMGLAMLVYLLPIVTGIAGYFALLARGEDAGLLGSLAGFLIGFAPALFVNRKITRSGKPTHKIISVCDK
ncbi:MAG TPA: SoxR reducing system RseC family protein [Terriglobales bacterium]|nr:SoxR reducing system RseC family protein [Terriglobales bacterium]